MSSDDSQPPVVLVISHVRAYFKLNWIVAHAMRAPPFHCLPPMFTLIRFLSCTMIPPPLSELYDSLKTEFSESCR